MVLPKKQREVEIAYLEKEMQDIRDELSLNGPNGYLADKLKAIEISLRNQRLELKKDKTDEVSSSNTVR